MFYKKFIIKKYVKHDPLIVKSIYRGGVTWSFIGAVRSIILMGQNAGKEKLVRSSTSLK